MTTTEPISLAASGWIGSLDHGDDFELSGAILSPFRLHLLSARPALPYALVPYTEQCFAFYLYIVTVSAGFVNINIPHGVPSPNHSASSFFAYFAAIDGLADHIPPVLPAFHSSYLPR